MRRMLTIAVLLTALSATFVQAQVDWTQYGFTAEPGVTIGTPCALNLMARFWYRNFGISTCGYAAVIPGLSSYLSGNGLEADVLYRFVQTRTGYITPYVALGYGYSSPTITVNGHSAAFSTQYVGVQGGVYYQGFYGQIGLGFGPQALTVQGSKPIPVVPLFQIGYTYNIGSGSSSGSSGGSSGGGSSGSGSSGSGSSGGGSGSSGGKK